MLLFSLRRTSLPRSLSSTLPAMRLLLPRSLSSTLPVMKLLLNTRLQTYWMRTCRRFLTYGEMPSWGFSFVILRCFLPSIFSYKGLEMSRGGCFLFLSRQQILHIQIQIFFRKSKGAGGRSMVR